MLLLFTLGAVMQVNDPDPIRWVGVYALAAATYLLSLLRRMYWPLSMVPSSVSSISRSSASNCVWQRPQRTCPCATRRISLVTRNVVWQLGH